MFEDADDDMVAMRTLWAIHQRSPADRPDPTAAHARLALAFGRRALDATDARLRR